MFHMNDDLVTRALSAYFKYPDPQGGQPLQPASGCSDEVVLNGKTYVVLANSSDVLAVYRVRNDGVLRRMKRPPAELLKI